MRQQCGQASQIVHKDMSPPEGMLGLVVVGDCIYVVIEKAFIPTFSTILNEFDICYIEFGNWLKQVKLSVI